MTGAPAARAVLFDLDGTLADTAPDLAAALNRMRAVRQLELAPFAALRPYTSAGARGLLGAGFGITPDHPEFEVMKHEFLDNYERALCRDSVLFDGVSALLAQLAARQLPWGIVTNKIARLTDPLVPLLGLQAAQCVISGDTTPHAKPHPAPLLEAARRLGVDPRECFYLGDDLRDIQAAKAAGMRSVAVAWGYGGASEPAQWDADLILAHPLDLFDHLPQLG